MKKVLIIDNYDSFTFNLVQYIQELGMEVRVLRNNEEDICRQSKEFFPDFLIFSPGPGTVENSQDIGMGEEVFELFRGKIPILGVCLGHQMIGKYFGGMIKLVSPVHGKKSEISVSPDSTLFLGLSDRIEVMRYHSLALASENFPCELEVTATTEDGIIMAFEKKDELIFGVQFHPESIGTSEGMQILENFLNCN